MIAGCLWAATVAKPGGRDGWVTVLPPVMKLLFCAFSPLHTHTHPPPTDHGTAVKQRIRAIKNIGKITKAMKMVAASKMRNAQVAVEKSRGLVNPFIRLLGDYPGGCF